MNKTDLSLILSAAGVAIAVTGNAVMAELIAAFLAGFFIRRP